MRAGWTTACLLATALLAAGVLVGCDARSADEDGAQADTDAAAVRVTAGIGPHAWLVRRIGGDLVDVQVLVQPGESPHTYQPSDAQISRVVGSRLFFRTGMPFERGPWLEAIHASGRGPRMADLRDGITLRAMVEEHHHHGEHGHDLERHLEHDPEHEGLDPHIWLSPRLLITQAATIAAALSAIDPRHAEVFAANLATFTRDAEETHARIAAALTPYAGRRFYIFHPAWGYFADHYRLVQTAVEVEGKEPTEHELTRLQRQARADGVRVIFVQPQIAGRTATALAAAIGGRVEVLDPLADEVLANLRRAADVLAAAFAEAQPAADGHESHNHE